MSLRTRIALGFATIVTLLLTAFVAVVDIQHDNLVNQIDAQLDAASVLALGPPPPGGAVRETPRLGDVEAPVSELYVGFIGPDGDQSDLIAGRLLEATPVVAVDDITASAGSSDDGRHHFGAPATDGSTEFRVLAVERADRTWGLLALPLTDTTRATRELAFSLGLVAVVIIVVLALTSWWIVRLGLRPIAQVTEAADLIAAGETTHRVDVTAPRTEAGRLATAFNVMLDERDANEQRLRQFVADASHELRTPLTSLRGYLDLYADGGFRDAGTLDDAIRRMRSEAMRMYDLVEDLLLLASLDQGRPLTLTTVDIGDVLHDAASDAHAMNPGRPIDVHLASTRPGDLQIEGDDARLRQVIASLVHNAVVHTPLDASIQLAAAAQPGHIVITVSDSGPGLDDHDAAHAFDRFYRGDPSRQRHAGGSGLGLPIAESIIEAHHGSLTLHTAPGRGCSFEIRLPAPQRAR